MGNRDSFDGWMDSNHLQVPSDNQIWHLENATKLRFESENQWKSSIDGGFSVAMFDYQKVYTQFHEDIAQLQSPVN